MAGVTVRTRVRRHRRRARAGADARGRRRGGRRRDHARRRASARTRSRARRRSRRTASCCTRSRRSTPSTRQRGISDPVGMAGTRLETEIYLVTCSRDRRREPAQGGGRAGYQVRSSCSSRSPPRSRCSPRTRRSSASRWSRWAAAPPTSRSSTRGKIRHLGVAPVGRRHGHQRPRARGSAITQAEAQKRQGAATACAYEQLVDPQRDRRAARSRAAAQTRQVARELIAHIIEQRLDEIFGLVRASIDAAAGSPSGWARGSCSPAAARHARAAWSWRARVRAPVRVGVPGEGLGGLADSVGRPRFATAVGLALYGARALRRDRRGRVDRRVGRGVIKWCVTG